MEEAFIAAAERDDAVVEEMALAVRGAVRLSSSCKPHNHHKIVGEASALGEVDFSEQLFMDQISDDEEFEDEDYIENDDESEEDEENS